MTLVVLSFPRELQGLEFRLNVHFVSRPGGSNAQVGQIYKPAVIYLLTYVVFNPYLISSLSDCLARTFYFGFILHIFVISNLRYSTIIS